MNTCSATKDFPEDSAYVERARTAVLVRTAGSNALRLSWLGHILETESA